MAEAAESYADRHLRQDTIGLTRKAIVNDDLGAFTDLAGKFGLAAAEFEAQFLVDLLESGSGFGPTMSDNVTLFDAAHSNLAANREIADRRTPCPRRAWRSEADGLERHA